VFLIIIFGKWDVKVAGVLGVPSGMTPISGRPSWPHQSPLALPVLKGPPYSSTVGGQDFSIRDTDKDVFKI
jgi:hypothetical protein